MGLRVTGIGSVLQRIENVAKESTRAARRELEKGAKEIAELAQQMAPRDRGHLESSIDVLAEDRGGIHGRLRFYVGPDEDYPVPERPGKTVGDYVMEMHDGDYDLGPGSLAKQKGQAAEVGPGYMERAAAELEPIIWRRILQALKKL